MPCVHHPGRPTAATVFGKDYCQQCKTGIDNAVSQVDVHVVPKECFVVYKGGDTWAPITGTGCAHWVAHQLGASASTSSENCLAGRTLKVKKLIEGRQAIARANVKKDTDIWFNDIQDHCGLVVEVTTGAAKITIRHDSSAQKGVKDNDFDQFFGGKGSFCR
jgi:hypothetical protein